MAQPEHLGLLAQIVAEALTKNTKNKNGVFHLAQRLTRKSSSELAQTRARAQGLCGECYSRPDSLSDSRYNDMAAIFNNIEYETNFQGVKLSVSKFNASKQNYSDAEIREFFRMHF